MNKLTAIILAAGKGTRMKSLKAKVLHEVFFRPMIHHVMDAVGKTGIRETVVVVGHQHDWVLDTLKKYTFTPVVQRQQLGTGHAVLCTEEACSGADTVLILCGDTPLIRTETLNAMIESHRQAGASLTLMTTRLNNPFGYGRVLTGPEDRVEAIVEEKDADAAQRGIHEINAGIYLADRAFLFPALKQVGTDNSQGEVYLTDIVALAVKGGRQINRFSHDTSIDVLGVNSRVELAEAHRELQRRRNEELMLSGVTMYGPETIYIQQGIPVGRDTVIHPGVNITGKTEIGIGCIIEPGVFLHDCTLNNNAIIGAWSTLHNWTVQPSEYIFPRTIRVERQPHPAAPSTCG